MIPVSVKDIISLLDKIPVWNQLKNLPAKIDALEKRVAELEGKRIESKDVCPKCKNESFTLISSKPHPTFGQLGVQERIYKCSSCDFEESKSIDSFS